MWVNPLDPLFNIVNPVCVPASEMKCIALHVCYIYAMCVCV